jgi:hypothetical protein
VASLLLTFATRVVRAQAPAPALDEVLARTAAYLQALVPQLANVVASEEYEQRTTAPAATATPGLIHTNTRFENIVRRFTSDLLLVRYPAAPVDWVLFREVTAIDGAAVRREEGRLLQLLADPAVELMPWVARVSAESARHFIPGGTPAVTHPFLGLGLVQRHYQTRMRFTLGGEERSLGPDVRVLRFEERETPADAGGSSERLPPLLDALGRVRGNVWVEVETGRIVKTEIRVGTPPQTASSVTTFAADAALGLTLPAEMRTTWVYNGRPVAGVAKYGNFRRFDVRTETGAPEAREP